jgi:hypothetical protein
MRVFYVDTISPVQQVLLKGFVAQGRVGAGLRVRPPVDTGYIYPNLADDRSGSANTSFAKKFP